MSTTHATRHHDPIWDAAWASIRDHNERMAHVPHDCADCGGTFDGLAGLFGHDCPNDPILGRHGADVDIIPTSIGGGPGTGRSVKAPATPAQVNYLVALGVPRDEAKAMGKRDASRRIDALVAERNGAVDTPQPTRTNRYAGTCSRCGGHVAAETGSLVRTPSGWSVTHQGDCPAPQAPSSPVSVAADVDVPAGHYAIASTGENDLAFYRVDRPTTGSYAGRVFVKLVVGGHPDRNVRRDAVAGILARIAADPDAAARYGQEIGRCCRCNRHLTDEASRAAGIGPECARKGF